MNRRTSPSSRTPRVRRSTALGAVGAVAASIGLAASPAIAAKNAHERPYVDVGTQTGTLQCYDALCSTFGIDLVGGGVATHLGAYTLVSKDTNVWTAANGDTLISDVNTSEPLDPSDVGCDADEYPNKSIEHFQGGTGRFAEATGSYTARSCLRIVGEFDATGTAPVVLRYWTAGTISY